MKNRQLTRKIFPILITATILIFAITLIRNAENPENALQTNVIASFSDVTPTQKYSKAINFLRENEIVKGYEDGAFRPAKSLTRAEFTKIVVLGTSQSFEKATKAPFPDVQMNEWYTDYIAFCARLGYINGYPDGTFKPNREISKVEALKILGELVGWDMESIDMATINNPYSDINLKEWYGPYVAYAISKNLLDDNASVMQPDTPITRGQMSEYIYRDYVVRELGIEAYDTKYDSDILSADIKIETPKTSYFAENGSSESEYKAAVKFARDEFIGNHPNKDTLIAFMEPIPYATGTEIAAYSFREKDGKSGEETLKTNSWLLFIDDNPDAGWAHPTQFIIINAKTFDYKIRLEQSWPVVNGYSLWSHDEMRQKTEFQVYPTGNTLTQLIQTRFIAANISSPGTLFAEGENGKGYSWEELDKALGTSKKLEAQATTMSDLAPLCECVRPTKNKYAIIINGMDEAGYLEEITRHTKELKENSELLPAYKGLKRLGYKVTYITSETDEAATYAPKGVDKDDIKYSTLANVAEAFAEVSAKAGCCDEVIVIIYGHGDGESVGINPRRYLPKTDLVKKDGKWELINLEPVAVGSEKGGALTAADIKALLNSLNVCRQKVVIVSCYSEGLLNNGIGEPASEGCSCRTTYVSSAADQLTWNGNDGIIAVMGKSLENGSTFLESYFDAYKSVINRGNRTNYPVMMQSSTSLCEDPDNDKICSGEEIAREMDPNKNDTDGDGISDYVEGGLDDTVKNPSDPVKADTDGDGLGDGAELKAGTDPHNPDTDGDKLTDGEEVIKFGLNPLSKDTDGEGYEDYDDLYDNRTNPLLPDTDGDSCTDWEEIDLYGTDPSNPKDKGYNCGCLQPNSDDDTCANDDDETPKDVEVYRYAFECTRTINVDPGHSTEYRIAATVQLVDENGEPRYANLDPNLQTYYTTSTNSFCFEGEFAGGRDDGIRECYNPVKNAVDGDYYYAIKEFYPEFQTTDQINEIVMEMWNKINYYKRACE